MGIGNCPIGDKYYYQSFTGGTSIPAGWVLNPNVSLESNFSSAGWKTNKYVAAGGLVTHDIRNATYMNNVDLTQLWTLEAYIPLIEEQTSAGISKNEIGYPYVLGLDRQSGTDYAFYYGNISLAVVLASNVLITLKLVKYEAGINGKIKAYINGALQYDGVPAVGFFSAAFGLTVSATVIQAVTNRVYLSYYYFIHPSMPTDCLGTVAAAFSGTPLSGYAPLTVAFTDSSSSDGTINQWAWDFGDGETSEEQNPTHTYKGAGKYTVSLTVTTTLNATDTETKADYLSISGANASYEPEFGKAPLRVNFTDESVIY